MKRQLTVLPEAEAELAAAATWYENQRPGLGLELIAEVDRAFEDITAMPEAWTLWRSDRDYRKRPLSRFPYVVFFRLPTPETVSVVSVSHAKRKPGYWLARIP